MQLRLSTKVLLMSFSLSKLAEGEFNRTSLITLRDGQQMVARVPLSYDCPKVLCRR